MRLKVQKVQKTVQEEASYADVTIANTKDDDDIAGSSKVQAQKINSKPKTELTRLMEGLSRK